MDRLRDSVFKLLKIKGLTQSQLAKKAGVSSQAINQFLSGKTKEVKADTLIGIARAFGVSVEDLKAGKNSLPNVARVSDVVYPVPLISWVAAGTWSEVSDNYPPGFGEEMVPCPIKGGPHTFALRVKGDSMLPDYPDGSVIVVDPDVSPLNNDDVVVRLNSDMEATFKRLKVDGSRMHLQPLNDQYTPIPLDGKDFTIVGVVIWMGRETRRK